ncbi:hypothetical protein HDU76_003729 [Blyttiomyces sp. JEL0837]|nr:hypothetical protein HDU76_003729 [Blyttiomyces sp. JEL0837]
MRVILVDDSRYGVINLDYRSATVFLDHNDEMDDGGDSAWNMKYPIDYLEKAVPTLESLLINIAMRNCWMDELEPLIKHL